MMRETILLKLAMWGAEGEGRLHYENDFSYNKGAQSYICLKIAF